MSWDNYGNIDYTPTPVGSVKSRCSLCGGPFVYWPKRPFHNVEQIENEWFHTRCLILEHLVVTK
jgi:hypothetical protein